MRKLHANNQFSFTFIKTHILQFEIKNKKKKKDFRIISQIISLKIKQCLLWRVRKNLLEIVCVNFDFGSPHPSTYF